MLDIFFFKMSYKNANEEKYREIVKKCNLNFL